MSRLWFALRCFWMAWKMPKGGRREAEETLKQIRDFWRD